MKKLFAAMLLIAVVLSVHAQTNVQVNASDVITSNNKLVIRTAVGQSFFTGWQNGNTYAFSQGIFRAVTDNPYGPANYYFDGVTNGVTNFAIRADGQGYLAGGMSFGRGAPSVYNGYNTLSIGNATNGGVVDFYRGNDLMGLVHGDGGGLNLHATAGSGIHLITQGTEQATLAMTGNLGLGTTLPQYRLEVAPGNSYQSAAAFHQRGDQAFGHILSLITDNPNGGDDPRIMFAYRNGSKRWSLGGHLNTNAQNSRFSLWEDASDGNKFPTGEFGTERFTVLPGGNVGIGTSVPDQKLTVMGTIHAKEVKIDLNVPGPDYVFEKTYKLKSLAEISTYIAKYKHLPEVASAAEMKAEGLKLTEMNMKLLQKVEELTLYLIQQKNEIRKQQQRMSRLETIIKHTSKNRYNK